MMSEPIPWRLVRHLIDQGMPTDMAPLMVGLRVLDGRMAFYEEADRDLVLWHPETGELNSAEGRAFALGGDNVHAGAGVFDHLRIHASPLDWLRDRGRGILIIDWQQTFDRLRDVPRVAVAEVVLPQYRQAMKARLPHLSVIPSDDRRAAA